MIGYIKGKITALFERSCFIETAGIGYRVYITDMDRGALHNGDDAKLYTYMAVREDAMELYGFQSHDAYEMFLVLLSVSKIGPRLAMSVLSVMTPEQVCIAVMNKDISSLTNISGIGKKTAERMIVELKDKVKKFNITYDPDENTAMPLPSAEAGGMLDETAMALESLGYSPAEVIPVIRRVAKEHPEISETALMVTTVLSEIGKERSRA